MLLLVLSLLLNPHSRMRRVLESIKKDSWGSKVEGISNRQGIKCQVKGKILWRGPETKNFLKSPNPIP